MKKSIFKNASEALYFKNMSIYYFLKLGSKELQHFYTKSMLDKHGFKHGKLWFSKTRWLQVSNIYDTLGGDANLIDHSIQEAAPLLDRFSPVAISLAMHYHSVVSKHQGVDRSYLQSLSGIFIFQEQLYLLWRCYRGQLPPCRHRCRYPPLPHWYHHLLHAQGKAVRQVQQELCMRMHFGNIFSERFLRHQDFL